MAKLSPNNRKYMTKEEMVKTIITLHRLHEESLIPAATSYIFLDHILWAWTEFEGKYEGCLWWSDAAYSLYKSRVGLPKSKREAGLTHEHVVPKEVIRKSIFKLLDDGCAEGELYKFMETHLIGCIVTKEEDNLLNEAGFRKSLGVPLTAKSTWNRYDTLNIKRSMRKW